jgi:hypothetical protein
VTAAAAESPVESQPAVDVRQISVQPAESQGDWHVTWLIDNKGTASLRLLAARVPHGQFRSDDQGFEPPLNLVPGESRLFRARVRCLEPPGLVTENAFLIFLAVWLDQSWRIFVRIRILIDDQGAPQTTVESITTQRVGFSGLCD